MEHNYTGFFFLHVVARFISLLKKYPCHIDFLTNLGEGYIPNLGFRSEVGESLCVFTVGDISLHVSVIYQKLYIKN